MGAFVISFEGLYLFSFGELKREPKYVELSGTKKIENDKSDQKFC